MNPATNPHRRRQRGAALPLGIIVVALILICILAWTCLYRVNEWEQAVVKQFGEVIGDPVTDAGLHFKLPYQNVQLYDRRLMRWDGSQTTTITRDRKTVNIDVTARWRISDAKEFLEAIGSVHRADSRLNGIIAGAVKDEVAKYDLYQVIRSSNRVLEAEGEGITLQLDGEEEDISMEDVATLGSNLPELRETADGKFEARTTHCSQRHPRRSAQTAHPDRPRNRTGRHPHQTVELHHGKSNPTSTPK